MKKFGIIFKYELMRQLKNKVFLSVTALFLLGSVVGGFIVSNKLVDAFDPSTPEVEVDKETVYVHTTDEYKDYINQLSQTEMFDIEFVESEEALSTKVEETGSLGLYVKDYGTITQFVGATSIMKDFSHVDRILLSMYQTHLLSEEGLSAEQIMEYQGSNLDLNVVNLGADGIVGYMYTYAYTFLLYMAVAIFGGIVSSSVVTEKTSKAMELLITSADSKSLIMGKVFAVGLTCVLQIAAAIVGFVGTLFIRVQGTPVLEFMSSFAAFRLDLILLGIFLFIIGFFSILFLYAGLASFATKPEDANTVVTPLMLIIMVVFMLNIFSMGSDLINNPVMKVVSYVPIVSPFLIYSRYAIYGLSNIEMILALITNLLGGVFLIWMAAKIYRAGTLHYGNTIKFSKIFKSLKTTD